jgi:hypothetical protein
VNDVYTEAIFLTLVYQKEVGGRDRVRTCDPLLAKQVLSQLSYTPTIALF